MLQFAHDAFPGRRPQHHAGERRRRLLGPWRGWPAACAAAAVLLSPGPAAGFHGGAHGGGAWVMLGLWLVAAVALALMVLTWLRDRREARRDDAGRPPSEAP